MNSRNKRAFTLVELLVVIGIIGILVAMLMPAVQMVREGARRTSCVNNLRQVSLGVLSYESSNHRLPMGITPASATRLASATWLTRILPYVEQQSVWAQVAQDYQVDPIPFRSHAGMQTAVSTFGCPSNSSGDGVHWTHNDILAASTNFLGVNGTNFKNKDGVFFRNSTTELSDITDGQSNSLMIGERPPSTDYWYGWWYAGHGRFGSGSPDMLLGTAELNDPPVSGETTYLESCPPGPFSFSKGNRQMCDTLHFWSHHPGGANFGVCDGSVHFISYDVDDDIMTSFATISGSEVADSPW